MPEVAATAMDSNFTTPASMSEQEVNLFKELPKIFGKFFEWLFAIIAAMNTDMGQSLFMTHHRVMMTLVFVIVLYFLTLVLGTMLQLHVRNFLLILVILLLGSVLSVLALMIISFTIAWIGLALWFCVFALIGYDKHQELYEMIPQRIKNLIEGDTVTVCQPTKPSVARDRELINHEAHSCL